MSYNYQPLKHFEQQQHQKKQKVVGQKQEKVRIPIVIVIVIACFCRCSMLRYCNCHRDCFWHFFEVFGSDFEKNSLFSPCLHVRFRGVFCTFWHEIVVKIVPKMPQKMAIFDKSRYANHVNILIFRRQWLLLSPITITITITLHA